MKNKIQSNDLPVLAKIFQPKAQNIFVLTNEEEVTFYQNIPDRLATTIQIFDKMMLFLKAVERNSLNHLVLINLSDRGLPQIPVQKDEDLVIIDFSNKRPKMTFDQSFEFDFINNPDNTIRWLYKNQLQKPVFLNLYNASGLKGKLIHHFFKIGFYCKAKNWLKSGSFQVFANQLFLEDINDRLNQAQYAVFTGTVGANRKAVVSFEEGGNATKFLKFPLTQPAKKLILTETNILEELERFTFNHLTIPKPKSVGNSLLISNVRPDKPLKNSDLTETHLKALYELYNRTSTSILLSNSIVWQEVQENIKSIEEGEITNNLDPKVVNKLSAALSNLSNQFLPNESMIMATAHGDLTPWNSYLSKEKLHVYDWELSEKLPLFYDAFHYIFQTGILVKKYPFATIQQHITDLKNHPIVQAILTEYKVDFERAYQLYLLRNVSYYLSRYMQQPKLHMQAHWLVDTWLESIENCLEYPVSTHFLRPFVTN